MAPTLYTWLTVASIMWPGNTIRAGMIKVKQLFKLLYFIHFCLKITDFPKTAKANQNPESKINLMKVIPLYNFHQVYLTLVWVVIRLKICFHFFLECNQNKGIRHRYLDGFVEWGYKM